MPKHKIPTRHTSSLRLFANSKFILPLLAILTCTISMQSLAQQNRPFSFIQDLLSQRTFNYPPCPQDIHIQNFNNPKTLNKTPDHICLYLDNPDHENSVTNPALPPTAQNHISGLLLLPQQIIDPKYGRLMLTEDLGQVFYILVYIKNHQIDSIYVKAITTPQAEQKMVAHANTLSFSPIPNRETDPNNPPITTMSWRVPQNDIVYTYVRREIDNIWGVDIIAMRPNPYLLSD